MNTQRTPVASACALLMFSIAGAALAQTAKPDDASQTVEVLGIRGSLQKSLQAKKEADTHVEVITAEDIGKMPDKNVADSLQRVPGVTISSAGATEGGFDENDRVSMRGTNPSLTFTQINGHPVSSGDWFILNQSDNAGRSVSYTLVPSELVSRVVVHKTSEASLVEGGVAGTVDIITRKPLEFSKPLTLEGAVGAVYSTLPGKTDPQFNALFNFKNEANNAGVLLQVFYEQRHLRRDGVEVLGYDQVAAGSATAIAHPDLVGVWYPRDIGAAFFEQERKRTGGLLEVQVKPTNTLSLDFSGFVSKLDASNYNRNYLLYNPRTIGGSVVPNDGYTVRNNTLVSATLPGVSGTYYGLYDQIERPDEQATTNYLAFEGNWRATDALKVNGKLGTSTGHGKTPTQNVAEWHVAPNNGASWHLNGSNSAPDFTMNTPANSPTADGTGLDWIFGLQNIDIKDKDNWAQLDSEYALDAGVLQSLKFGLRAAKHTRGQDGAIAQGPGNGAFDLANWPSTYSNYPGNFGSGLGGNIPQNIWYFSAAQMEAVAPGLSNRDPVTRAYLYNDFGLRETSNAAYVQAEMEGKGWSGNAGLRLVQTKEHVLKYVSAPATAPGAIVGSAFGPSVATYTDHTYNDVLPSLNLKMPVQPDLIGRFAVAKTMTRPDYAALAGALNLTPPATGETVGSGNGSNPDLKPVRSTNVDLALEWYHAPRALLSAALFYMRLNSYVSLGQETHAYPTFDAAHPNGWTPDYLLTVPVNSSGKVKGFELALEEPIAGGFGVTANYTYADAKEDGGAPIVGASKNTYNLVGYYEDDRFNARLAYNYRSQFYSGLDRSTAFNQAGTANLAASLGWKINENLSLTLDGMNLTNEKLRYFALNEDQPRAIYQNGRQYYLTLHAKM